VGFLRRQLLTTALAANAVRPAPGWRASFPAYVAGFLTNELAPQLLAATAADTATHLARGRTQEAFQRWGSRLGLVLAAGNTLALAHLVHRSVRVREEVEEALTEGIGLDYVERLDAEPTPADLRMPWRSLVYPFRMVTPDIEVIRNLPYTEAGRRGHLDIYRPRDVELDRAPVLLQVHGGAWVVGDKSYQGLPLMTHLAARGWVCVAINYRLAPRDPFPAHIIDVKRAIAWVREHIADYGGDPDYLAITGGSAGGHLAALAALTPGDAAYQPGFEDADTSVQVAVPHYGVYDMAGATGLRSAIGMRDRFLAPRVMRTTWEEDPGLFEDASPLLRITPDAPDFFVLHGTHDTLVSVEQARLFVARLREVSGSTVAYAELPGAQHAWDVFTSVRSGHVVRAVDRYLHWHWNGYRRERGLEADRAS
jgi:acetyl esterase/lipase